MEKVSAKTANCSSLKAEKVSTLASASASDNPASISSNTVWKGTPNLSFITSCKLGEGCNFLIRTPISDAMFDAFYESSKHYLTWIHDNFLTPKYATYKMFAKKKEI